MTFIYCTILLSIQLLVFSRNGEFLFSNVTVDTFRRHPVLNEWCLDIQKLVGPRSTFNYFQLLCTAPPYACALGHYVITLGVWVKILFWLLVQKIVRAAVGHLIKLANFVGGEYRIFPGKVPTFRVTTHTRQNTRPSQLENGGLERRRRFWASQVFEASSTLGGISRMPRPRAYLS